MLEPSRSEAWPTEAASRAKLYIPDDYDPYQPAGEEPGKCVLEYDPKRRLLILVSTETGETLDVINPDDIIGASVAVELLGPAHELRANSKHFQNKQDPMPSTPEDCGIFQSLAEDTDKLFSVSRSTANTNDNEPTSEIPFDTQAAAVLTMYVYPRVDPSKCSSLLGSCGLGGRNNKLPDKEYEAPSDPSKLGSRHARHRRFQIAPAEDFSDISTLVRAIRTLAGPPTAGSRLLVVVNPFSGNKLGTQVYEKDLAPMLDQAGFEHDCMVTQHAGHAEERMKMHPKDSTIHDIKEYDGVIAVGGDGVLHEIFQGIKDRPDFEEIMATTKLGHIGAGTSNGFAKSLTHACQEQDTATDYCFQVAKGKTVKMDISRYYTQNSQYISFLTYSYGIIADIDIESEAIRFLGSLRMDVWGVWRVLNLRTYRARFSYVPAGKHAELPPLGKPLSADWVTEEDDFIMFWASHVTHAAEKTFHSLPSKPTDGVFTILIVRKNVSRLRLALILLALETGGHGEMHGVEFIQCTAYRMEPLTKGSFNDIDGEVVESGPIQARLLAGAAQVFCTL
eukprot:CAMPEP_0117008042 /NCGR_PEP_ID=MMETSP0472-20121206/7704_1 /TAXON_ID=693140 ORGANISM="Tiarina fusus, Strain LIS" /NCGR_SAMPLE_ID=MMETSP0472 /ASSEMBLY_ACC=CAM_ASM_000603 /LENGTH=562 /DNA_ID=CAMNT_0004709979 /DNA_START=17 /DNA_END=1705 /DNA_ORIENTATION=-